MDVSQKYRACPWCGAKQPGVDATNEPYRCHSCDDHIRRSMLVDDAEKWRLDEVERDFCPHCAFPCREIQPINRSRGFQCVGCLIEQNEEDLITAAEIRGRRWPIAGARPTYLWFFLFAIIAVGGIVWMILP
jgi:hypothetical protein